MLYTLRGPSERYSIMIKILLNGTLFLKYVSQCKVFQLGAKTIDIAVATERKMLQMLQDFFPITYLKLHRIHTFIFFGSCIGNVLPSKIKK